MEIAKKTRLVKLVEPMITNGNAYKDCEYRVDVIDSDGYYREHYFETQQEAERFQQQVQN